MRLILGLVLAALLGTSAAQAQQQGPISCNQMASPSVAALSAMVAPESGADGLRICGWTISAAAASAVTFSSCLTNTTILTVQLGTTATHGDSAGFRGFTVPAGDALCMAGTSATNFTVYYSLLSGPSSPFFPGATIDCNLATGASKGTCTLPAVTRAGANATNLLPTSPAGAAVTVFGANTARVTSGLGLLVEEPRTNQLLNSRTPATQTTGSLANATYTLWVNGTGSATMSTGTATGCGTGVATQGTPVSFTTSGVAGTCTVTVAGSLNAFQLEAGSFGTSLIVTTGATGTRAGDVIAAFTQAFGSAYSVFVQGTPLAPAAFATAQDLIQTDNGTDAQSILISRAATTSNAVVQMTGGAGTTFSPTGTLPVNVAAKLAFAVQANAQASILNNGTIATGAGATLPTTPTGVHLGQNITTPLFFNGYIARFALWPNVAISNALLSVITR